MATPARRGRPAAKPAAASAKTPARGRPARPATDVTEFANRPATPYHKAFAQWLVREVGYDVTSASPKAAFLAGIRLAATARTAFNASDAAEEFYATSGEAKRGRKPQTEAAPAPKPAARKRRPEPEPAPEEEEWEDDDDAATEDEWDDDDTATDETTEEDDSDDDDDDAWEDDDDEEEPAPAPKRAPARKAAPAKAAAARPTKAAAPARRAKPKPADDDDDFIF